MECTQLPEGIAELENKIQTLYQISESRTFMDLIVFYCYQTDPRPPKRDYIKCEALHLADTFP